MGKINPRSTDCEAHALTTTPSRRLNVAVYGILDGSGKHYIEAINYDIFLVLDYVYLLKSIKNNWKTENNKELTFMKEEKMYVARWRDIEAFYNEDRKNCIHRTKITYKTVYPKPLQRQSVSAVCQAFHKKTVAALPTLKKLLDICEETVIFVKLITDWFKIMNVKDRYSSINMRDECCQPRIQNYFIFKKLYETCEEIFSSA